MANNDDKKPYYLHHEEQEALRFRRYAYQLHKYISEMLLSAIEIDINGYIDEVVKKRLNISKEIIVDVDLNKGMLFIPDEKTSDNTQKNVS